MTHTSQVAMQQICHKYYEILYTARQSTPATEGAKFQALRYIQDRLFQVTKTKLGEPMQLRELHKAITEMSTSKSPGPDGVALEFFKELWPLIGQEYLELI
jgi:hypothetical protein